MYVVNILSLGNNSQLAYAVYLICMIYSHNTETKIIINCTMDQLIFKTLFCRILLLTMSSNA